MEGCLKPEGLEAENEHTLGKSPSFISNTPYSSKLKKCRPVPALFRITEVQTLFGPEPRLLKTYQSALELASTMPNLNILFLKETVWLSRSLMLRNFNFLPSQ